jgi:glycine cleavage system H protein
MNIPESLLYTKEHEWARVEGKVVTVGITDHAQAQLGDITFVELPKVGEKLDRDSSFGVVESVKAVSDLYAPITGEVIEVNERITESPEGINVDPYGDAWMIKMRVANEGELKELMSAKDYEQLVKEST